MTQRYVRFANHSRFMGLILLTNLIDFISHLPRFDACQKEIITRLRIRNLLHGHLLHLRSIGLSREHRIQVLRISAQLLERQLASLLLSFLLTVAAGRTTLYTL